MLNEFYSILRGLESVGESLEIKHPDIKEPGNNTTFRVVLGAGGGVESVDLMDRERIKDSWSWGDKKTQFPAVKVKKPLIDSAHTDYAAWKEKHPRPSGDDYRALLNAPNIPCPGAPMEHIDLWPDRRYRESITDRRDMLEKHSECEGIHKLFDRFCKHQTGVEILAQVRDFLVAQGKSGDNTDYKEICSLLFGDKLKSGKDEIDDASRVTLLLDCLPSEEVRVYASSRDRVPALSKALLQEDAETQKDGMAGICSVSGDSDFLVGETFPEEKIKVVGSTIIFAKNDITSGPTVKRYGKAKGEAFPLSQQLSYKLAAAAAFLCRDSAKEKTWSSLPGNKNAASLLLAFCLKKPNVAVTPLVTGQTAEKSEIEDLDDYLHASEEVIGAFKGHGLKFDHQIDFVEIIAIDKANRKVNFKTTARVCDLEDAAASWGNACENAPDLKLFSLLYNKEKEPIKKLRAPWPISPRQMMYLFERQYIRGGTQSQKVVGLNFADAMVLFLGGQDLSLAGRILHRVSEQYEPLTQRCALGDTQYVLPSNAQRVKVDPKLNTEALKAVTLMSILLFKSGRPREDYMKDLSFQLGQLCSAMDELHIGYCVSERSGDIPSTLLGNQAYGMALHSPVKALAFMAERRKPYDSWAKRYKAKNAGGETKDKPILAALGASRWIAEHAAALASLIHSAEMGESDTHKAELMLGYLAGRPFPAKGKPSDIATNTGDPS